MMICTEFYDGQGLGNQLWLYVVTRVKALDLKTKYGVMHPEKFKGMHFLNLDFGEQIFGGRGPEGGPPIELPNSIVHYYKEPTTRHLRTGQDISGIDSGFYKIVDSTKLDGNFQSPSFIRHRKSEIRKWLLPTENYRKDEKNPNECIINFRGGEYRHMKDVFLPSKYWETARKSMYTINPRIKFKVTTDDPKLAQKYFPKDEILDQDMAEDFSDIFYAKYLILSNSSFGWFPAWLNNKASVILAPKFWWGFNRNEYWSTSKIETSEFTYLDLNGNLERSSSLGLE